MMKSTMGHCLSYLFLLLIILSLSVSAEYGGSGWRRKVRCMQWRYHKCFLFWQFCPWECPTNCVVDCVLCKPVCSCNRPGAVCQDPRFVGGDGIAFYFHGQRDRDFCLVSDHNLHINGHFIGKRNPAMIRDFTWVQSIGILYYHHQIYVGAQKTGLWNGLVDHLILIFNGNPISLPPSEGAHWESDVAPHVSLTRTRDNNAVAIEAAGNFMITAMVVPITEKESRVHGYNITNDDCFAHLELGFKFYALTDDVDGVLGQTYRKNYTSRAKMGVAMAVLGGDREFSSTHLFTADCVASQFSRILSRIGPKPSSVHAHTNMQCNSGMNGIGMICKR